MKKKIRSIQVDEISFNWRAVRKDETYLLLRIWKIDQKQMPWLEISYPYISPWLFMAERAAACSGSVEFDDEVFKGITPGKVATIIRLAMHCIGKPNAVLKTQRACWEKYNARLSFD